LPSCKRSINSVGHPMWSSSGHLLKIKSHKQFSVSQSTGEPAGDLHKKHGSGAKI
jgi:hypothetical protein